VNICSYSISTDFQIHLNSLGIWLIVAATRDVVVSTKSGRNESIF
jgi:hypothetical protein